MTMTRRSLTKLVLVLSVASMVLPTSHSAGQKQMEMTQEAQKDAIEADRKMNEVYRRLMAQIGKDPESKERLIAAQRAWLKFRDLQCRLEGDVVRGGSMQPQMEAMCEAKLTQDRTETLEWLLRLRDPRPASTQPAAQP